MPVVYRVRATDVVVPSDAVLMTPVTADPLLYVGWVKVIGAAGLPPLAVTWAAHADLRL